MITLRFAQVFVRNAAPEEVRAALLDVLARDGYALFDAARIPAGYPAGAREIDRFLLAGPDDAGIVTLVASDVRRAFDRCNGLAAALPRALLAALVLPPAGPLRAKLYRDGALALKVGDDPDEELFYTPLPAEAPSVSAFLLAWGASPVSEASPDAVARMLGVARADLPFDEAAGGGWPVPVVPLTFLSRRSRLFLES